MCEIRWFYYLCFPLEISKVHLSIYQSINQSIPPSSWSFPLVYPYIPPIHHLSCWSIPTTHSVYVFHPTEWFIPYPTHYIHPSYQIPIILSIHSSQQSMHSSTLTVDPFMPSIQSMPPTHPTLHTILSYTSMQSIHLSYELIQPLYLSSLYHSVHPIIYTLFLLLTKQGILICHFCLK